MSRPGWRQPVRIAEAISAAFQRLGLDSRFRQSEIWCIWSAVVGPQIARHAQPHTLSHGRLVVHVTDPVWLHHLSMMRPRVIAALNERLQASTVRELILRVGQVEAPPATRPEPAHRPEDPHPDPAHLARVEALLSPLRDCPFRGALKHLLLRAYRPADHGSSE